MAKFASHMGDPRDPQTSPQHADPHGFLVWFSLKSHQIHVDRRVVDWSAGRHVDDHMWGQISPWPARKVTDLKEFIGNLGGNKMGRPDLQIQPPTHSLPSEELIRLGPIQVD